MNEEKPWLSTDGYDVETISGNRSGLKKLINTLSESLESVDVEIALDIEDSDLTKIRCTNKKTLIYGSEYKENLRDKLIKYLFVAWFVVLPFMGFGFLMHWLFIYEPDKELRCFYPQSDSVLDKNLNSLKGFKDYVDPKTGSQP